MSTTWFDLVLATSDDDSEWLKRRLGGGKKTFSYSDDDSNDHTDDTSDYTDGTSDYTSDDASDSSFYSSDSESIRNYWGEKPGEDDSDASYGCIYLAQHQHSMKTGEPSELTFDHVPAKENNTMAAPSTMAVNASSAIPTDRGPKERSAAMNSSNSKKNTSAPRGGALQRVTQADGTSSKKEPIKSSSSGKRALFIKDISRQSSPTENEDVECELDNEMSSGLVRIEKGKEEKDGFKEADNHKVANITMESDTRSTEKAEKISVTPVLTAMPTASIIAPSQNDNPKKENPFWKSMKPKRNRSIKLTSLICKERVDEELADMSPQPPNAANTSSRRKIESNEGTSLGVVAKTEVRNTTPLISASDMASIKTRKHSNIDQQSETLKTKPAPMPPRTRRGFTKRDIIGLRRTTRNKIEKKKKQTPKASRKGSPGDRKKYLEKLALNCNEVANEARQQENKISRSPKTSRSPTKCRSPTKSPRFLLGKNSKTVSLLQIKEEEGGASERPSSVATEKVCFRQS